MKAVYVKAAVAAEAAVKARSHGKCHISLTACLAKPHLILLSSLPCPKASNASAANQTTLTTIAVRENSDLATATPSANVSSHKDSRLSLSLSSPTVIIFMRACLSLRTLFTLHVTQHKDEWRARKIE